MNVGIIGLPQAGKKTLFELLTGESLADRRIEPKKPLVGLIEVSDPRFDRLLEIYSPQKRERARLGLVLFPKIEQQTISQGRIFKDMGEVDAFCHVVRCFEDDAVYHVWGSVNPKRDIDFVNSEFVLHDLIFVEKRIERIEKSLKKVGDEGALGEKELLREMRSHLERELPLRVMGISGDDRKVLSSYPLLTLKEMVVVLNVSDTDLDRWDFFENLEKSYHSLNIEVIPIAVQAEAEINALDSEEEKEEFMSAMGIRETALHTLARHCIKALGLVSFFTVRRGEVRQWFVKRGSTAVEAAGTIHTDLGRGFIRAEVMSYDDLIALGSEEKVKSSGKLRLKGKDYIVQDGDILGIRFKV